MYLSRPPISPTPSDAQLAKKTTVPLHRGKGNVTTAMVADQALRHPVTQQFQKRWQNQQSDQNIGNEDTRVGEKGSLPANKY